MGIHETMILKIGDHGMHNSVLLIHSSFFLAASFQDTSSLGQLGTCFTVRIDFWHPVYAETYVKIGRARNVKYLEF